MDSWTVVMVLMLVTALQNFQVASVLPQPYWLSIDCGATSTYQDEINLDLKWETDDKFIKTGENKFLLSTNTSFPQTKTLRSFPSGTTNCYNMPLKGRIKYLVRAGFLYGNYDNLQKPPTFVLKISGYSNVTVYSGAYVSVDEPIYHEFMILTKAESVDVCVGKTLVLA